MKNLLVKFNWYYGRQGNLEGIFIINEKNWELCQGKEWYASDVLGKHSEVNGTIDASEFTTRELNDAETDLLADIFGFSKEELEAAWDYEKEMYVPYVHLSGFSVLGYFNE